MIAVSIIIPLVLFMLGIIILVAIISQRFAIPFILGMVVAIIMNSILYKLVVG